MSPGDPAPLIERLGHVPLPPYIHREDDASDRENYQTVFAKHSGAIAAPTAGLHFTNAILERLRRRGIEICELTLDVGLGTFQPIREEIVERHAIHTESYEIPDETAERIRDAKTQRRPVVAIGTTVVRALEDAAAESGHVRAIAEAFPCWRQAAAKPISTFIRAMNFGWWISC